MFEFGPPRKAHHPEYPFWRLQNDGVWRVETAGPGRVRESASGDGPRTELLEQEAAGGLEPEIYEAVRDDPGLLEDLARRLLDGHFPQTLHGEILNAVGLGELGGGRERAARHPGAVPNTHPNARRSVASSRM